MEYGAAGRYLERVSVVGRTMMFMNPVALDPDHPHRPHDGELHSAALSYRDHGLEAPWLLAWADGQVLRDGDGRYLYSSQLPGLYRGAKRGSR